VLVHCGAGSAWRLPQPEDHRPEPPSVRVGCPAMYLVSLIQQQTDRVTALTRFLRLEWENSQRGASDDASEALPYDIDRVRAVGVNTPRQDNGYDCGVYVLKFAEVILRNCLALQLFEQADGSVSRQVVEGDLAALLPRDAFAQEDVDEARRHVRSCIDTDARQTSEKRPPE
jgi:hypothetical protein